MREEKVSGLARSSHASSRCIVAELEFRRSPSATIQSITSTPFSPLQLHYRRLQTVDNKANLFHASFCEPVSLLRPEQFHGSPTLLFSHLPVVTFVHVSFLHVITSAGSLPLLPRSLSPAPSLLSATTSPDRFTAQSTPSLQPPLVSFCVASTRRSPSQPSCHTSSCSSQNHHRCSHPRKYTLSQTFTVDSQ